MRRKNRRKSAALRRLRVGGELWLRDIGNILAHGPGAPRHSELIYVDTRACRRMMRISRWEHLGLDSARIVSDWPWEIVEPLESEKIKCCVRHWAAGQSWEETGIFQFMDRRRLERPSLDGCRTHEDTVARYARLDRIFAEVQAAGRLQTRQELTPGGERERGAAVVHVGPNGEPFFGGVGYHRFAIAHILDLPLPAVVGAVHRSALAVYPGFRLPPAPAGKAELDMEASR